MAKSFHYNTVHFNRAMMFALGLHSAQVREDWLLLRSMGNGTRQGAAEIESFEFAGYCARKIAWACLWDGRSDLFLVFDPMRLM